MVGMSFPHLVPFALCLSSGILDNSFHSTIKIHIEWEHYTCHLGYRTNQTIIIR